MNDKKFEHGIEVKLKTPDSFLIVKETLTRIGITSKNSKTLYQSCHILHKCGRYYVLSFLELFLLDGKATSISDNDFRRRNTIAKLLHSWKLCEIENLECVELLVPLSEIKIVSYKEKKDWALIPKYTLGQKKNL